MRWGEFQWRQILQQLYMAIIRLLFKFVTSLGQKIDDRGGSVFYYLRPPIMIIVASIMKLCKKTVSGGLVIMTKFLSPLKMVR